MLFLNIFEFFQKKHLNKTLYFTILILLVFTAVNALIAGILFIIDPSGALMQMSPDYIKNSPFDSYLIPGIILFLANGVLNVFTAISVFLKKRYSFVFVTIQGFILSIWIIIQIIMVDDINFLHITMFAIGFVLIAGGINLAKR